MTSLPTPPDFEPEPEPVEQHVDYTGYPNGRCDRCHQPIDDHPKDEKGLMLACPARVR